MDVYEAIHEMRELSKKGQSFSFTFMSCNLTAGKSDGAVEVLHGRLLSREDARHHRDAEFVERYIDMDTTSVRHFYQPLLMTFNGNKLTLS